MATAPQAILYWIDRYVTTSKACLWQFKHNDDSLVPPFLLYFEKQTAWTSVVLWTEHLEEWCTSEIRENCLAPLCKYASTEQRVHDKISSHASYTKHVFCTLAFPLPYKLYRTLAKAYQIKQIFYSWCHCLSPNNNASKRIFFTPNWRCERVNWYASSFSSN